MRVEACVLSNETLFQQDGGEPIVWAVLNEHDVVLYVSLSQSECEDWVTFGGHS